jgi:hypothetical protein
MLQGPLDANGDEGGRLARLIAVMGRKTHGVTTPALRSRRVS